MFPKMSNDTAAEELVAPTSWMCVVTKSDNGLALEHDVEAFAVLTHERGADIEPKVIWLSRLTRLVGRLLIGHSQLLSPDGWVSTHRRA